MPNWTHARPFIASIGLSCGGWMMGCGSVDPTESGGTGQVLFTTWGEDYIENVIPRAIGAEPGFVDGWELRYQKFLVNFANIAVASSAGEQAASMPGSRLFDNHAPGVKRIVQFDSVPARAWDRVSYEIVPVTPDTELDSSVDAADAELMLRGGYSVYVSGVASKAQQTKHFAWGFALGTRYTECRAEQEGRQQLGVVVRNHLSVEAQLTTHGDHLFYDRLQASPDPGQGTALRFEALAEADTNSDAEVTLAELGAQVIDVRRYNPAGLGAVTYGAFVTVLARSVGHFRGEGECNVARQ